MKKISLLMVTVLLFYLIPHSAFAASNDLTYVKVKISSPGLSADESGFMYSFDCPESDLILKYSHSKGKGTVYVRPDKNGHYEGFVPIDTFIGNEKLTVKFLNGNETQLLGATLRVQAPEKTFISPEKGACRKVNDLQLEAGIDSVHCTFTAPGHTDLYLKVRSVLQTKVIPVHSEGDGLFDITVQMPLAKAKDKITVSVLNQERSITFAEDYIRLLVPDYSVLEPINESGPLYGIKVCLDPGHSGIKHINKSGLVMPGSNQMSIGGQGGMAEGILTLRNESVVVLEISYYTANLLRRMGADVIMTRYDEETALSNWERADIANEFEADYFIRIHLNMFLNRQKASIYSYIPLNSEYALQVASKEEYRKIGNKMHTALEETTGRTGGRLIASDQFIGSNWAKMVAFLLEVGCMSNPGDDLRCSSIEYQQIIACGIANGVLDMARRKTDDVWAESYIKKVGKSDK